MSRDTRFAPGYPSVEFTMNNAHNDAGAESKWRFILRRWVFPLGGTLFVLHTVELLWPHWKIWHRPFVDMPAEWYVWVVVLQLVFCVLVGIVGGLLAWRRSRRSYYLPFFSETDNPDSLGPDPEPTDPGPIVPPPVEKWRFLLKTTILFTLCGFLLMATLELTSDARMATADGVLKFSELFEMMAFRLVGCAAIGCILAFFAWRRKTTDFWPASKDHPDTSFSRLGPL